MELGEKLKWLRTEHKFSQEDVAKKMNTTRQAISRWEHGKTTPDIVSLKKLAELYGITIESIVSAEKTIPIEEAELQDAELNQEKNELILALVLCIFMLISGFIRILGIISAVVIWRKYQGRYKRFVRLVAFMCIGMSIYNLYMSIVIILGIN